MLVAREQTAGPPRRPIREVCRDTVHLAMPNVPKAPLPEREQTDESLRVEREKTDEALDEIVSAIDDYADAIVTKARGRAAEVLAAAKKKSQTRASRLPEPVTPREVASAAAELAADDAKRDAKPAIADDDALRAERAEHLALLERERLETDNDLERERRRADAAVATRDEFLGIVSHDLRNMLQIVASAATLLAEDPSPSGEKAKTLGIRIGRSGARMDRLIGDLVDVASIEAGVLHVWPEPTPPADVVREAVENFHARAEASHIELSARIDSPLPMVAMDSARILQVLVNLLSNAFKFTPAGGNVVVRVEPHEGELRFSVTDTGEGIPANRLEDVFDRFRQLAPDHRRGLGLGLYISRCIVEGHGGRIWAESEEGKGSRFVFTVPLLAKAPSRPTP
jgi:signal transduction histidine kinase